MCFKGTNPSKTCFVQEDRPQVKRERQRDRETDGRDRDRDRQTDRQRLITEDFVFKCLLEFIFSHLNSTFVSDDYWRIAGTVVEHIFIVKCHSWPNGVFDLGLGRVTLA